MAIPKLAGLVGREPDQDDPPLYPGAVRSWLAWRRWRVPADVAAWLRTNVPPRSPVERGLPWLNMALIDELDRRLRRGPANVFEWGAGGSTVFFASRASRVVTVEHDERWVRRVADELRRRGLDTVDLRHVPGRPSAPPPEGVRAPLRAAKLAEYGEYVEQVHRDGDRYDVIVVDGRARLECAEAAAQRLAPGGMLVVDDVDKPGRWDDVRALLPEAEWRLRPTWGPGPSSGLRLVTAAAVAERR